MRKKCILIPYIDLNVVYYGKVMWYLMYILQYVLDTHTLIIVFNKIILQNMVKMQEWCKWNIFV